MIQTLGLLSLILTVANICIVNGDEGRLVQQVCDETPSPDECKVCLNGTADTATVQDLALGSLSCSLEMNAIVDDSFAEIAKGSDDYEVKEKCRLCRKSIGTDALENLENAVSFCDDDRFSDAANQAAAAIDKWEECSELAQDLPASLTFVEIFIWLKNLYMDTYDIINQLYLKAQ